jgi:hypothetical protein
MKEIIHSLKPEIGDTGKEKRIPEPGRGANPERRSPAKEQDKPDNMAPNEIPQDKESGETTRPDSRKSEVNEPIQNKQDGLRREEEAEKELQKQYPEKEGYEIIREAYLRDKDGNIVKDPVTGEARRVDFVIVKDGKVVRMIEVTSKTADKTGQSGKEQRIRENGGNYIRGKDKQLLQIGDGVQTEIVRKD